MAEKRRSKQKRQQEEGKKPTKEEYAVAKFLRFNTPLKQGKLMGMDVQYFIASKAIDALLESKWSATKKCDDALFVSRATCIAYCNTLLQKGIFHRAVRAEKTKDRDKKKKKGKDSAADADDTAKEDEKKAVKKEKKTKRTKDGAEDVEETEKEKKESEKTAEKEKKESEKKDEKKDEDKKKKRKLRLEMAEPQLFIDGEEIYVWIYDPMPLKSKLIGVLIVVGAIAVCLFPLWPPEVRLGVYYISLAAAGFVGFILSLCVVQRLLFLAVWACTLGTHHFWLLPNLTEDVSFFDSFKPFYKHDKKKVEAPPPPDGKDPAPVTDGAEPERGVGDSDPPTNDIDPPANGSRDSDPADNGSQRDSDPADNGSRDSDPPDNGYEMVDSAEVEEAESHVEDLDTKKTN